MQCKHENAALDVDLRASWVVAVEDGEACGIQVEHHGERGAVAVHCHDCGGRFYYPSRSRHPRWVRSIIEAAKQAEAVSR